MVLTATLFVTALLSAPTAAAEACGAPAGTDALLDETAGRAFVIGELHGTQQAPAFAASAVCLALSRGESVVLGLEMSVFQQERLDAFLASDGGDAARAALLNGSRFWGGDRQDGRRSVSMFALIERARMRRADGAALEVVGLDAGPMTAAEFEAVPRIEHRPRVMTRNTLAAMEQADRVIVLVGSIHARANPLEFRGRIQPTIGSLGGPDLIASIQTLYATGEAWNCRLPEGAQELSCQVHPAGSDSLAGPPRVLSAAERSEVPFSEHYQYAVFLGPATASPPAISD